MGKYTEAQEQSLLTVTGLKQRLTDTQLHQLKEMYNAPGRYYHVWNHMLDVLRAVWKLDLPAQERSTLSLAALFHDAVYKAGSKGNEVNSVALMHEMLVHPGGVDNAAQLILSTRFHATQVAVALGPLHKKFLDCDILSIATQDWPIVVAQDLAIHKEYQAEIGTEARPFDSTVKRLLDKGRKDFLRAWLECPSIFLDAELGVSHEWRARQNITRLLGHDHYGLGEERTTRDN